MLKKIEAIIKEEQLPQVKDALAEEGFVEMTVYPVKGRGTRGGITLEWRAGSYKVDFLNKVMLMMVVSEREYRNVVAIITSVCKNDPSGGAGKIIVSPVDEIIRIRTGERNEMALSKSTQLQDS